MGKARQIKLGKQTGNSQ